MSKKTESKKSSTTKAAKKLTIVDVAAGETEAQAKARSEGTTFNDILPKPEVKAYVDQFGTVAIPKDEPKAVPVVQETKKTAEPKAKAAQELPTQREAVYANIIHILDEEKVSFDNSKSVKELLTEDRMKKLYANLTYGFVHGKIALKDTPSNKEKLAKPELMQVYIKGLVENWVKKDDRLNGVPKKK